MAIYYARKAGNVNATDVWATTPGGVAGNFFPSFTNSDTLMANSFAITVNVNTTVLEVKNDTTGGATAGGSFTLNNGITLTANTIGNQICSYAGVSPNSATIIGNITGTTGFTAANNTGTGTLNVIGNITGGTASGATGIYNGPGILNITGNVIAGSSSSSEGARNNSSGTTNITGNVIGGNANTASYGVNNNNVGTVNIIGTVTGGASAVGAFNGNIGIINIIGTAIGGSAAIGATNNTTGTLTVTRAKGNGFGNGSVGLSAAVGVNSSQNGTTRVYEIEYGDLGQSPTSGPISIVDASSNVCLGYRTGGLGKKTLVDATATSGAFPANSDVRNGVSFNGGSNIGTMNVPSPSSVAYGISVDNTTGTAVLTPANVWDYLTSNISASGSIGERLKNCSTIASVGQQLSDSLSGQ